MIKRLLPLAALLLLLLSGCTLFDIIRYNEPGIDDHEIFHKVAIPRSEKPFTFIEQPYRPLPPMEFWLDEKYTHQYKSIESFLIDKKTTAFLVIHKDSIIYENYFNGLAVDKPSILFSVTKPIVTTLVGIALEEGYFESIHQKASDFIEEFANDERREITLNHLLQMTSGLNFRDKEDVFRLARAYYNKRVNDYVKDIQLKYEPGTHFSYKSIDTQLLGICLEKALNRRAPDYLKEKLWDPIGMEYDGFFTLDQEDGVSRMYGGFASTARDLAKIGRLFSQQGEWQGEQLVPKNWVLSSADREDTEEKWWAYANGWWLDTYIDKNVYELKDFYAAGFKGQFMYVNPAQEIIIVRLGKARTNINWRLVLGRLSSVLTTRLNCFSNELSQYAVEGTYINAEGEEIIVNRNGQRWAAKGIDLKKIELQEECPQSLFNKKRQKRLIFQIINDTVVGLFFDDFSDIVFYRKSS